MGFPKALMPLNDQPAIVYLSQQLHILNLPILITLPENLFNNKNLMNSLNQQNTFLSTNIYEKNGFLGSIQTAIKTSNIHTGLIIIPIDLFFIDLKLIQRIISLAKFNSFIMPYYYHLAGHPFFIGKKFFLSFMRAQQGESACTIIEQNKKYARGLFWPNQRILQNINCLKSFRLMANNQNQL